VPLDRAGRVPVGPDLSLPGRPHVFAVGDLAAMTQANGQSVPGVAQGAIQSGACAARNIRRALRGLPPRPFRYADRGNLAVLGRSRAVADLGGTLRVDGVLAWLLWLFVHLVALASFRNRIVVIVHWAWEYFTYQRGVRLILGTPRRD
jgi:NADH dehydrogenase